MMMEIWIRTGETFGSDAFATEAIDSDRPMYLNPIKNASLSKTKHTKPHIIVKLIIGWKGTSTTWCSTL